MSNSTRHSRPEIPKRLVARIRGAQTRVSQKRLSIVSADYSNRNRRTRVEEFEQNPEAFAARYYRGHGVDSYPVQTTIARDRERLEYHAHRRSGRIQELAELELALQRTEDDVLLAVGNMAPRQGRVPWPKRLPSFEQLKNEFETELSKFIAEAAAEDARRDQEWAVHERRRSIHHAKREAEIEEGILRLPERERGLITTIRDGIASGEFTIMDLFAAIERSAAKAKN